MSFNAGKNVEFDPENRKKIGIREFVKIEQEQKSSQDDQPDFSNTLTASERSYKNV